MNTSDAYPPNSLPSQTIQQTGFQAFTVKHESHMSSETKTMDFNSAVTKRTTRNQTKRQMDLASGKTLVEKQRRQTMIAKALSNENQPSKSKISTEQSKLDEQSDLRCKVLSKSQNPLEGMKNLENY